MTNFSQTFVALKHRNFRLFWSGQCVSLIGTWMQNIAQSWLVLELTHSAFWLGVVGAIQFLPMMFFSLFAGSLIDRFPKKRVILFTQFCFMILASILAFDTFTGLVKLWHVLILAGLLGMVNTLDMPARQSFLIELVGKEHLMNAIVLNSSIFNLARVLGPSVAGFTIAKIGMDWCFFVNAISFVPVIAGVSMIRVRTTERGRGQTPTATASPASLTAQAFTTTPTTPETPVTPRRLGAHPGQTILSDIRSGLSYVAATPRILVTLLLLGLINIFAMNFNVLVPLYAKDVFHGGADTYGLLMSANGLGALVAALYLAVKSASGPKVRNLTYATVGICVFEILLVPTKVFGIAFALLSLVGFWVITFTATTNSLIQVQTPNHLRGRVMSLYTMVFAGFSPIGSFLSGIAANAWGAPATIGLGAAVTLLGFLILLWRYPGMLCRNVERC